MQYRWTNVARWSRNRNICPRQCVSFEGNLIVIVKAHVSCMVVCGKYLSVCLSTNLKSNVLWIKLKQLKLSVDNPYNFRDFFIFVFLWHVDMVEWQICFDERWGQGSGIVCCVLFPASRRKCKVPSLDFIVDKSTHWPVVLRKLNFQLVQLSSTSVKCDLSKVNSCFISW